MSKLGRVVVAMSGGVDSSAAAVILHEQGYEVIGVSMQVWDYRNHGGSSSRATCCAPADFDDARTIADNLGFPFYVFDFEQGFREKVIKPFIDSHQNGLTPNPCLNCNRYVKFKELRSRASVCGAEVVATGHYASIKEKADGSLGLFTSEDLNKDQTYFLYALTQDELKNTLFPVGEMEKEDVRALLADRGFKVASKAESQDICFVSGSAASFVENKMRANGQEVVSGEIVDSSGERLGEHGGVHRFTVGQRKGLGLSNPHPLYVLNINADSGQVMVGEKEKLEQSSFVVQDVNWISEEKASHGEEFLVKLRYRHPGVKCRITKHNLGGLELDFLQGWTAVSPGQAAVFYSLDTDRAGKREVLGGGIIGK